MKSLVAQCPACNQLAHMPPHMAEEKQVCPNCKAEVEPVAPEGKALYAVLALVAGVGIIAGLVWFVAKQP